MHDAECGAQDLNLGDMNPNLIGSTTLGKSLNVHSVEQLAFSTSFVLNIRLEVLNEGL